ncbi:MAG: alkaline phosphatase family protein, partial [Planctomycetes bacterium]|nr:alkaline phosphatase family protein [Planctomycetota bacterium]
SLSAMCVPELRGTQGMFSFYTTRQERLNEMTGGESFLVERQDDAIQAHLLGPVNPILGEQVVMKCPFTIKLNGRDDQADLTINGSKHKLVKDVYTDWLEVVFKAGAGMKIRGICQFLLLSGAPDFELYVTPINISPDKPVMPIAQPRVYSTYLSKSQGPYATLGLAEDSWALNEKVIDEKAFLHQCVQADEEREKMFFDSLEKVNKGVCVCVFDGTDRLQHTFWRYLDKDHPANQDLPHQEAHQNVIADLYQRMDVIVGKTMQKCDQDDTVLMVISDHGFNAFRYGIDLNRWLEENGYLTIDPSKPAGDFLVNVDWSKTRAYGLGLAGIYLNIKGRESCGIVESKGQAEALRDEIAEKLTGLMHPERNEPAIRRGYNAHKVYKGPYKKDAPDIIVGYNKGYRVAWETAVGRITEKVVHDNIKAWAGDHCIDPSLLPGVLFCNRKIRDENPRLMDLAPTALDLFGIKPPAHMDGVALSVETNGNNGSQESTPND